MLERNKELVLSHEQSLQILQGLPISKEEALRRSTAMSSPRMSAWHCCDSGDPPVPSYLTSSHPPVGRD